jgi:hypothetical protein
MRSVFSIVLMACFAYLAIAAPTPSSAPSQTELDMHESVGDALYKSLYAIESYKEKTESMGDRFAKIAQQHMDDANHLAQKLEEEPGQEPGVATSHVRSIHDKINGAISHAKQAAGFVEGAEGAEHLSDAQHLEKAEKLAKDAYDQHKRLSTAAQNRLDAVRHPHH